MAAKNADGPAELKVTRLEVVDAAGQPRVVLGQLEREVYGMFLDAANGQRSVVLHDNGGLRLIQGQGEINLMTHSTGANLQLNAAGHRPRAMLYANDNHAGLQLCDTKGEINQILETRRIKLPADRKAQDPFGN